MVNWTFWRSAAIRSGPMPQPANPSVHALACAAAKSATDCPAFAASPSLIHGWKSAAARFGNVRHRLVRSPFGSINSVGTPDPNASSTSTIPRPVLPEPVIPTMTPCVVKSPDATVVSASVRSCLTGSICPPRRKSAMAGTLPRRLLSGLRGGLDTVCTAAIAVHHVLRSADRDIGAERALEHLQLRLAQRAARHGGVAYRAVMLDQQEPVAVFAHLGQVPLVGADVGEAADTLGEVGGAGQRMRVAGCLSVRSCGDDAVERIFA